ncbi:MAG: response regulator [Pseudomonadota bacterium]
MRILIIEDNAAFRNSLRALLCSHSDAVEVLEAADAGEALDLARTSGPGLIFVDIQLPGGNGLSVTRDIKAFLPDTPVAILTSYDLPEYRSAAADCGANHFLGKDTSSADDILGLVDAYLHPAV